MKKSPPFPFSFHWWPAPLCGPKFGKHFLRVGNFYLACKFWGNHDFLWGFPKLVHSVHSSGPLPPLVLDHPKRSPLSLWTHCAVIPGITLQGKDGGFNTTIHSSSYRLCSSWGQAMSNEIRPSAEQKWKLLALPLRGSHCSGRDNRNGVGGSCHPYHTLSLIFK